MAHSGGKESGMVEGSRLPRVSALALPWPPLRISSELLHCPAQSVDLHSGVLLAAYCSVILRSKSSEGRSSWRAPVLLLPINQPG